MKERKKERKKENNSIVEERKKERKKERKEYFNERMKSKKVKLATAVKGSPKAPFQKLLHRGVAENVTRFLGLLHFTLDP